MARVKSEDQPNPEHMVEEIRTNIRTGDAIKLRLVLDQLPKMDRKVQNRLIYELSRADASVTIPLLHDLAQKYPELNHTLPIVKETLISQLIAHPDLLIDALWNPEISDKSIMIGIAGELKLEEAIGALIGLLGESAHGDVNKLVVEAIGAIGGSQGINTLKRCLDSTNPDLTYPAVTALGQLGTVDAINWLAERMGTDQQLDLFILDVLGEIQDPASVSKLNETLRSQHTELRVAAKEQLVMIGEKAVPILLENLKEPDSDLQIHTLNVLGEIGDASAIVPIRKLQSLEPENPNVRFAAYETLAMLPLRRGAYALAAGLSDPEDHVCIAAARAIDRNLNEVLIAGIMNLIRTEIEDARHIVKTIINAQVDNIFLNLIDDEVFQQLAVAYLPDTHQDIQRYHLDLLRKNGLESLAADLANEETDSEPRTKICAIDDSRVILSIYRATLHELGFEPVLFEFPASALEWLRKEKPALVLTDLNMPKISGIHLAEKIRELHSKESLPIIMVTTQSDIQNRDAVETAGVNEILLKPFDAETLKTVMARHIPVR